MDPENQGQKKNPWKSPCPIITYRKKKELTLYQEARHQYLRKRKRKKIQHIEGHTRRRKSTRKKSPGY